MFASERAKLEEEGSMKKVIAIVENVPMMMMIVIIINY